MAEKHEITAMLDSFKAAVAEKYNNKKKPMRVPRLASRRYERYLQFL